jgi:hypothetical protein
MIYALAITIFAGLFLLMLLGGLGLLIQRGGWRGLALGSWRWRPNAVGFTVLALVAGLLLWRVFPELLLLPIIIPFLWRGRGRGGQRYRWAWRSGRRRPPSNGHRADDGHAIEGQYRSLDDE